MVELRRAWRSPVRVRSEARAETPGRRWHSRLAHQRCRNAPVQIWPSAPFGIPSEARGSELDVDRTVSRASASYRLQNADAALPHIPLSLSQGPAGNVPRGLRAPRRGGKPHRAVLHMPPTGSTLPPGGGPSVHRAGWDLPARLRGSIWPDGRIRPARFFTPAPPAARLNT